MDALNPYLLVFFSASFHFPGQANDLIVPIVDHIDDLSGYHINRFFIITEGIGNIKGSMSICLGEEDHPIGVFEKLLRNSFLVPMCHNQDQISLFQDRFMDHP